MRRSTLGASVFGLALSLSLAVPTLADASPRTPAKPAKVPTATVLYDQVVIPYNLALSKGNIYITDGATASLLKLGRDTTRAGRIAIDPAGEVAGVATSPDGRYVAYTSSDVGEDNVPSNGKLTILGPRGRTVVADLAGFEARRNADGRTLYGIKRPTTCQVDALTAAGISPRNRGIVESHPYSVTWFKGSWIVADAAANALLKVSPSGRVSTLAVLPPQPLRITAEAAAALGLPDCVVGAVYSFEPVPTDVEVGPNGQLYVTTLPGGPEDPRLGARGSVYKVNPRTGNSSRIASGLVTPTNLAIHQGKIYVAELFADRISVISHGKPKPYLTLRGALAVESDGKTLYASNAPLLRDSGDPSSVVRITLQKPSADDGYGDAA